MARGTKRNKPKPPRVLASKEKESTRQEERHGDSDNRFASDNGSLPVDHQSDNASPTGPPIGRTDVPKRVEKDGETKIYLAALAGTAFGFLLGVGISALQHQREEAENYPPFTILDGGKKAS